MKRIAPAIALLALVCGCASVEDVSKPAGSAGKRIASAEAPARTETPVALLPPAPLPPSGIGRPIAEILEGAAGKVEIFDAKGQAVETRVENAAGSVSIHNANPKGQDNYSFGADGMVIKHLRSYGADYSPGVWTPVE